MKKVFIISGIILIVFILTIIGYLVYLERAHAVIPQNIHYKNETKKNLENGYLTVGKCWVHNEEKGVIELYIEGSPIERGVYGGMLTDSLIVRQECAFVKQIRKFVPSEFYLKFLKYVIAVFNKNIYKSIPEEYQEEIYGISLSASHDFDFIANPYQRILNYHGAHDLGHMLQNLGMVGCTSFGVWGDKSEDGSILIARNFDFYLGDEFLKEKIVAFVNPDSGYKHAFITWGGMMGAVSGMNEKGITVTINAANSEMTFKTATPVSIVARNILQYASDLKTAVQIASRYKIFVSEQFLIGSAIDNKAIVIEKNSDQQVVFYPTANFIANTNHFQTNELSSGNNQPLNDNASNYRLNKVLELVKDSKNNNPVQLVKYLRDTSGSKNEKLGIGNEKAVNQFIAHHSIVFQPSKLTFWVSTSPHQMGGFLAYDLRKIFKLNVLRDKHVYDEKLNISSDSSLINYYSKRYSVYLIGKENLKNGILVNIDDFIQSNPYFYHTYELIGDYYIQKNEFKKAFQFYKRSFNCKFPGKKEEKSLIKKLAFCIKKMQS